MNRDDLHPEEHEEHGVQDIVEQLPEEVDVVPRRIGHCFRAPVVAYDQPGDHHRQLSRYMQVVREGISTQHWRDLQQHLDLVVVETAQEVGEPERAKNGD